MNPLLEDLASLRGDSAPEEPRTFDEAQDIINMIASMRGAIPDDIKSEHATSSVKYQNFVRGLMEKAKRTEEKFIRMCSTIPNLSEL